MFGFLMPFLKNPRDIGAVAPSGVFLARKMMAPIQFDRADSIVEYGPGTGSFTGELVKRKRRETKLLLIEQNPAFFRQLKKAYGGQEGVFLANGSAEHVNQYMAQYGMKQADYIVSGLPFTSLPVQTSENILRATQKAIGSQGHFLTFQYSMAKKDFFQQYFNVSHSILEVRNLPPAFVLVMKNRV